MWYYIKTLEYPVNLKSSDLKMAKLLITQYGGPEVNWVLLLDI